MIKRIMTCASIIFFAIFSESAFSSVLFNVAESGTPAQVSITLCLNGQNPLSCQNYNLTALTLSINTTTPQHTYSAAGIKVNTSGYKIGNLGVDCTPFGNGYCLFSVNDSAEKTITLAVTGSLPMSPSSLPAATLSTAYSQTVIASGGVAPYTYEVTSGSLPAGLTLNSSTGVISGTPTTDSTYDFTITATDSNSNTGSKAYSIVVSGPLPLSPSSLPAATLSTAYSQTVTASGGVTPYTYAITSGSLPAGLSLNTSTGVISGTPTTDSTYDFTITATDANSNTGSKAYSIVVSGSLLLSPSSLPTGIISTAYSQTITASNGTAPYTYAITSGSLPSGLTLNTSTGVISGTPSAVGTFNFTVTATDTDSNTGSKAYSLIIYVQLTSCVYSISGSDLSCTGVDLTALGAGSSIYRHYSGGSCPFAGGIYNSPGTSTFTSTTYVTVSGLESEVVGCDVALCNNSTCSAGQSTSVLITSGS